ncbi:hypothetical protein ACHAW5_000460 [Stephanodiscus triporus]|uniref:RNA helicase n=1 Tax=Stephanodiscus triporus TaxID=2934178 RepID=A0ABD3NTT9_9STRA
MSSLFRKKKPVGGKRKSDADDGVGPSPPPPPRRRRPGGGGGGEQSSSSFSFSSSLTTFADLGLSPPLASTCRKLGFARPTPVQRAIIPRLLRGGDDGDDGGGGHLLALSATGSGKTAAFALPLLQVLSSDPYGIFALVLTPTRELAKQISQQVLALGSGSGMRVTCALVVGGEDVTRQNLELGKQPNFVVATPGRLAELCRAGGGGDCYHDDNYASSSSSRYHGPNFSKVKFVVLDEADRLLCAGSGFERDVAECLLRSTVAAIGGDGRTRRRDGCRTLLFSATMTRSLKSLEDMAGAGVGRLPLERVVVREDGSWDGGGGGGCGADRAGGGEGDDDEADGGTGGDKDEDEDDGCRGSSDRHGSTPNIPAGLRQEYVFMPSRVREAYLLCAVRTLMTNGGRGGGNGAYDNRVGGGPSSGWNDAAAGKNANISELLGWGGDDDDDNDDNGRPRRHPLARSAIIFAPTCERCAHLSGILTELGVRNVALHSLLSQNRRLASLGMFQSQRVRVLVATDVASRGLDIPEVDLVINAELPRRAVDYVHRVGRTARAGRRGRSVSLVGESDVDLVHEAERISGRPLEKCVEVTDEMAVRLLGPVAKASRLTRMKLMDIGFDELVAKHRERKRRDRRRREKAEGRARKAAALASERSGKR